MTRSPLPLPKLAQLLIQKLWDRPLADCLEKGPSCTGRAILSHSIQSAVILEAISEGGHITTPHRVLDGFSFRRVGRRVATTFSGFCAAHDTALFREVDYGSLNDIDPTSPLQNSLHFLRAISIELWKKRNSLRFMESVTDRDGDFRSACAELGTDPDSLPPLNDFARTFSEGTYKGLNELAEHYDIIRKMIAQNNFGQLIHYSSIIPLPPQFTLVSVLSPHDDLAGSPLYDFHEMVHQGHPMPHMALFVLPHPQGVTVIFSALRKHRFVLEPLFNQIKALNTDELQIAVSRMILNHCENIALRPSLIESWSKPERAEYLRLFRETIAEPRPLPSLPALNLFIGK